MKTYWRAVAVAAVLTATAVLTGVLTKSERIVVNGSFSDFPMHVAPFQGHMARLGLEVFNVLGVEDYVLADYRNPGGDMVNLYVGFYQSQKQGDIIHSPKNCMPGSGWKIIQAAVEKVPFKEGPATVAKLLIQKGEKRQVVLYWFQSRGRIIASEYMQKVWLVVDAVIRQRTDGSFVRLISPVTRDVQTATERLKTFALKIKPELDARIPS